VEERNTSIVAEAVLVGAARRGDATAFERLVDTHRRALHAYSYRMLGSVHDADDALQDTLLAAWRGISGFQQRRCGLQLPPTGGSAAGSADDPL
jgi:hypothetical protein